MTLEQMASLKRWHNTHRRSGWIECQLWDLMLTCWVLGWVGLPEAALFGPSGTPWICLGLIAAPTAYVAWRAWLHRRGVLRCDWLSAVAAPPRQR